MTKVHYEVVEHDGGWAYRVDGVFSETFATHDLARAAADGAARRQGLGGEAWTTSARSSASRARLGPPPTHPVRQTAPAKPGRLAPAAAVP